MEINLRNLYPNVYHTDEWIEVSEEIWEVFRASERAEAARTRQMYRYKAQYSLDRGDGLENCVLKKPPTPLEVLEKQEVQTEIYTALTELTPKQARRIYACYYLEMKRVEVAQAEQVCPSRISDSIQTGFRRLAKQLAELRP